MFGQFDLAVQEVIAEELERVRENHSHIDDIFAALRESSRREIHEAFVATPIAVRLGYPRDVTELPGVFVTLGSMQESDQTIGEGFGEEVTYHQNGTVTGDPLYWEEERGTFLQETLRLCCWSENANLTVWLQNVVTWALLRRRSDLTDVGFLEQRVGASDFEPLPRWFPSFAYRRDVTLQARHAATFRALFRPIAAVEAEAQVSGDIFVARVSR